ncbi:MAG TPA: hypothetical protein VFJ72_15600 [Rubrobacteraceae bacterium]|nr:hypothetical protein [Rubrobacteraceae bacterium]
MDLTHEYIHHRRGYRFGVGFCWIRIYGGEPGDAPVIVCEELPDLGDMAKMSGYLAAEVIVEHFANGLPDLPRPMLWIEHRPRRRGPGRYFLLTFPGYAPHPEGAGFVRRVTLGQPLREPLTPEEVAVLTGES